MKIRKLKVSERDRIVDGDMYAYAHWLHPLCIKPKLGIINPNDVLVAEIDGTIAAALQCFEWSQWVRGSLRSMGGIGGVWTYPEFRNRGCVKALMKAALMEMDLRGLGLSMLMPFKESFYGSLGYVVANSNLRLTIPLAAWQRHIAHPAKSDPPQNPDTQWRIERRPAGECQGQLVDFLSVALHGQVREQINEQIGEQDSAPQDKPQDRLTVATVPQSCTKFLPHDHGVLLPLFNPEQWWHLQRSRLAVWVNQDQEPMGVALYGIDSSGNLPFDERHIDISAMFARSESAWTQLLGFFASHRDQIAQVKMTFPFGVNPHHWFRDSPTPLQGSFLQPWMVRVVNTVNALNGLRIGTTGDILKTNSTNTNSANIVLTVTDPDCGWNNGLVRLSATAGVLTAKHITSAELNALPSLGEHHVQITITGLAALIYGTARAIELWNKGEIETNLATVVLLEQWFPEISLYNPFLF